MVYITLGILGYIGGDKLMHRKQFICGFSSQFHHETLIVEQYTLHIYTEQAMTNSKLDPKFCSSSKNSWGSLFVWFSFVLAQPNQRKAKIAEMNLGEVVLTLCDAGCCSFKEREECP